MGGSERTSTSLVHREHQTEPQDLRLFHRRWWLTLALIPPAVLLLQLPISLPVWNLLPKLRFLQFPWRWLVALEAPMGIFFAAAVWPNGRWQRKAVVAVCTILFLAATVLCAHSFFQLCDDEDAVQAMFSVYRTGAGFAGTDEYAPPGADNAVLASGLPAACLTAHPGTLLGVPSGIIGVAPAWTAENGSCDAVVSAATGSTEHLRFTATIAHPGYLILRLRSYPAWRVLVNGRPVVAFPKRKDGLMTVPVPQGPVDLTADWTTTPDVLAGRWIGGAFVLLLTALCLAERRLSRPRLS